MGNPYGNPDPRYSDPRYPQPDEPTVPVQYNPQHGSGNYPPQQGAQGPYYNEQYVQQGDGRYVQSQQQSYEGPHGNRVERRETSFVDREAQRASLRMWLTRFVYFLLSVLEIILILRFAFRLLGANPYVAFVQGLYSFSDFFVSPFNGIFGQPSLRSTYVFDVSTLIAMLIYALVFWGIVSLIRVILAPTAVGSQSIISERRRQR
jgi:hypothetical protein